MPFYTSFQVTKTKNSKMIEIRILKLDGQIPDRMCEVAQQCFGEDFVNRQILQNTWRNCPLGTRVYAAYENRELLAFNFFLAHRAIIGGAPSLVFQSCHSGTSTSARGRGLFSKIINYAKEDLALHGDYIVGFPNDKSEPIFLNKLGFKAVPLTRIYIPCTPASLSVLLFDINAYDRAKVDQSLVRIDQYAAAHWKQSEQPGGIIIFEYEKNFIWGRPFERIVLGRKLIFFDAGGCELNKPLLLKKTLESLRRMHGVDVVRFVCSADSLLGQTWRWQLGGDKTEPLIWFPLRKNLSTPKFDVYTGLKDVY